ncbi:MULTISPECIES: hypothetical protein [unclassified Nonomuraea]|uniref:hypothetical protein n=1 Tax=unclassified Nonomuraea TaxID=2593643 RepID=UPI0033C487A8
MSRLARRLLLVAGGALSMTVLAGCASIPFQHPEARPVGVGLNGKGEIQFFAPLCDGERVQRVEVVDYDTFKPLWMASGPDQEISQGGRITLGDAKQFKQVETEGAPDDVPVIGVNIQFADGSGAGIRIDRAAVPASISSNGNVLGYSGREMSEQDFRARVRSEFCS